MFTAPIISILRHRIDTDGDGVFTLVGLYGCHLQCRYCINQECHSSVGIRYNLSPLALYNKVKIDEIYFLATNGGVCFGGGEPGKYADYITNFREICGAKWKISIETSLNVLTSNICKLIPVIDNWIIDIKDMDSERYFSYTNETNDRAIDGLKLLADKVPEKCLVKVPLIPYFNNIEDVENNISILKSMGFCNIRQTNYKIVSSTW